MTLTVISLSLYREVTAFGSNSSNDDIGSSHSSFGAEAKTDPAAGVDRELEQDGALDLIKSPLQPHLVLEVQVFRER